ncbi:MAG: hypothetical protein ABFR62_03380 [Bacteroidota bacterium]
MSNSFGNNRTKIAQFFYNKIQKKAKETKVDDFAFVNVKSIGIIFDENSEGINEFIQDISQEFKSKSGVISIFELAYNVSEAKKPEPNGIPTVYFTDEDVNRYGKPKFKDVINFIETPFDLLINLAENGHWPIRFSAVMSKAKFKVGRYEDNSDVYDFMVDTGENISMKSFYGLILNYLKIINASG